MRGERKEERKKREAIYTPPVQLPPFSVGQGHRHRDKKNKKKERKFSEKLKIFNGGAGQLTKCALTLLCFHLFMLGFFLLPPGLGVLLAVYAYVYAMFMSAMWDAM